MFLVFLRFEFLNHSLGRRLPSKMFNTKLYGNMLLHISAAYGLFQAIVQDDAEGFIMVCLLSHRTLLHGVRCDTYCVVSVRSPRKPPK